MNEVSIIINGVRYDAVEDNECVDCSDVCALDTLCTRYMFITQFCEHIVNEGYVFKKSDKKFEP